MSLKGLTQLEIRKDKSNIFRKMGELPPIDYNRFVEAIEKHRPFFIWQEDTIQGKSLREFYLQTKGHIPDNFYKHSASCIPVKNQTYYRFRVSYLHHWNIISIVNTAPARMTIDFLEILYDVAEGCESKLYYSDTRFITKDRIEKEKELVLQRKARRVK